MYKTTLTQNSAPSNIFFTIFYLNWGFKAFFLLNSSFQFLRSELVQSTKPVTRLFYFYLKILQIYDYNIILWELRSLSFFVTKAIPLTFCFLFFWLVIILIPQIVLCVSVFSYLELLSKDLVFFLSKMCIRGWFCCNIWFWSYTSCLTITASIWSTPWSAVNNVKILFT